VTAGPIVVGVALREDDAAPLALARGLARLTGSALELVSAYRHDPGLPRAVPELDAVLLGGTLASVEEIAGDLREQHAVGAHAIHGSPTRVLHELCASLEARMLVVGSSHRGRLGRVLAGSVTAGVLHGSSCPVTVAPRGYAGGGSFSRIAVAYDGSAESRDALAAAVELASLGHGRVHSFTVATPATGDDPLGAGGFVIPDDFDARRARAEDVASQVRGNVPEELLEGADVVIGAIGDALADAAHDADLLVCGSRGYGPLRSVALGGVSRALVNMASCPVLVLPRAAVAHSE
jgi:nucleotide-binding universal stress UspA family protein